MKRRLGSSVTKAGADVQAKRAVLKASNRRRRWGVVLAGGDGVRLRPLTRFICGDDRPKQFCPLVGESTLLEQTRKRAERALLPEQIIYAVTRSHEDHYLRDLRDRPSFRIVQPCNKGTAPAILYSLLHIARMDRDAVVAILPSDHYYAPENRFTATLELAFEIAQERPQCVLLLGAQPRGPEVEYGWIELGETASGAGTDAFHVTAFHEKPSIAVAERLLRRGSLWNTFVMVGHVRAFLELAWAGVPGLLEALRTDQPLTLSGGEAQVTDRLYDQIDSTDFSRQVLAPGAKRLVTLSLGDIEWNDLGDPDRVLSTLLATNSRLPGWALRWRAATRSKSGSQQHLVAIA